MDTPDTALSWRRLLAFAAPVFPFAGQEIAFKIFLPLYLVQATRLSVGAIAVILLVFRVWDTLNDPLVGWMSDHWRHGHRRFVPMVLGVVPALAGVVVVLAVPQAFSPVGLAVALVVVALGWTLVNVPHGAWALELAPDPVLRTRVFAARAALGLVALPLFALGPGVLEHLYGPDSRRDAMILGAIMVVTLPLSLLWLRAAFPQALPAPAVAGRAALRAAFGDRDSVLLLALFACLGVHQEVKDGLVLIWVHHGLHLAQWGWTILLVQALVGMAALPLWVRMQARYGTRAALRASLAASAVATLGFVVVPAGSVATLLGLMVGQGLAAGAAFTLLRALLGDHFDRVAARHGVNLAGTLYSGFHLAYNFAVALTLPAVLWLLGALGVDLRGPQTGAPLAWTMALGGALPLLAAVWLVGGGIRTIVFKRTLCSN